jgi:hypothetical protein
MDFPLSAVADGGEGREACLLKSPRPALLPAERGEKINLAEVLAAGNFRRSCRADEVLK